MEDLKHISATSQILKLMVNKTVVTRKIPAGQKVRYQKRGIWRSTAPIEKDLITAGVYGGYCFKFRIKVDGVVRDAQVNYNQLWTGDK